MEGKLPRKLSFSFLPIPEELMKSKAISDGAKLLFGIIAKSNLERIRYRIKNLSERMGCSDSETKNRIKELRDTNFLLVKRTGRANMFQVNLELVHIIQREIDTPLAIRSPDSVAIREPDSVSIHDKEGAFKETSKEGNPVAIVRGFFIDECKRRKGIEPEMAFGKEGKLLKEKLKRYSQEQLTDLVDKFLNSEIGEKLGWTLSICLSAPVINQWLAGRLEKQKKPYFKGSLMRKLFDGRWQVLVDGRWLEFAGKESEIVFK